MTGQPQVSIRLATDGKPQVVRDFADVGDAGDQASARLSASFNRAANEADAALERVQKAAARLSSVQTPVQQTIGQNTSSGYGDPSGTAQRSAAAFQNQMDAADRSAQQLLASVDPLFAAQMRYNTALDQAIALEKMGALSEEQFVQVKAGLKATLDEQSGMLGRSGLAANQARIAQMELEHAVRGSMDAFAAGMPPAQIFSMHLGMLAEAATLSGGSFGKVGAFLAGPWGIALTVGVMALGPLISKLLESGDGVDSLVAKLKKEATQAKENDSAHLIFAQTLDGVTDATRRNEEALKKMGDAHESAAQKALAAALAQVKFAQNIEAASKAIIAQAKAQIALDNSMATGPETKSGRPDPYLVAADAARKNIDIAEANLAGSDALIAKNQADVLEAMSRNAVDIMQKMADPVQRIKTKYDALIEQARQHALQAADAARKAGDEAKAQQLVTSELEKQIAPLKIKEEAEIKAAEARGRKGPANAGGTAIFDAQIASFFDIANRYRGDSETGNKGVLEAFFREAGENLDPEKTAWCAAFVNAVLAAGGVHGTGSLAAKSFLTYGKDDTHSPQQGDVVVLRTGANQNHVGFLDSIDKNGTVHVLAGNTSNKVGEAAYSARQVLAIRRPPTPSEQAAFDDKETQKAAGEQTAFDDQLAKLHEQYLTALQKVLASADDSAAAQFRLAQEQHDAEATKIAANLAEGKYGAATSDLAKARARQLAAANDAALSEKDAAISIADFVKRSKEMQAINDRRYSYQLDDLKFASEFARSSDDKRKLALETIDVEYQIKLTDLQALKARQIELQQWADADATQAAINRLPHDKAHAAATAAHNNMSPWDDFLNSLPQSWGEVKDIIEKDGVQAIADFNSQLADAIANGKSIGDVLHSVFTTLLADLIKLGEQEAESALFGKPASGSGGGSGAGGLLGSIASLFGGGGGGSGVTSLDIGSFADNTAPMIDVPAFGNASGNENFPGGLTWVGENGKELVNLPSGSKIFSAADSRRMAAANDSGAGSIQLTNYNDFRGADASAVGAINARMDQFERDFPSRVAKAWTDASDRFVFRGRR